MIEFRVDVLIDDQILRGYFTKYDASSADLAPLGSISKSDIKRFQLWTRDKWNLPILTVCNSRDLY
jgi:NAD+ synthase (glutamine-hydrolysing)